MKKTNLSAAQALVTKAGHDLDSAVALLEMRGHLEIVCFHLQQAAEKYLKGFIQLHAGEYPRTHDLVVLLDECRKFTTEFEIYRDALASFAPYAVQLRYEIDFTPDEDETKRAHAIILRLRDTLSRLAPETFSKDA